MAAITQEVAEVGQILGGGDDQNLPNASQHEGGQGVEDHGFIINRQQLFRCDHRQRIEPSTGAAGENNAFHRRNTSQMD